MVIPVENKKLHFNQTSAFLHLQESTIYWRIISCRRSCSAYFSEGNFSDRLFARVHIKADLCSQMDFNSLFLFR